MSTAAFALPPLRHWIGEMRVFADYRRGRAVEDEIAARWPGDGRAVMVLPGLLTDDDRTHMLRRVINKAGYKAHRWKQGRAMPIKADLLERLDERIDRIEEKSPVPVSLVGWSLGGLIAREYAKHAPHRVAEVITLGSPFSGDPRSNRAWRIYEMLGDHKVDALPIEARMAEKPPVPTIAIWSKRDGIIPEAAARGTEMERDRDIEVNCGHLGMWCAPDALEAVLRTLHERNGAATS